MLVDCHQVFLLTHALVPSARHFFTQGKGPRARVRMRTREDMNPHFFSFISRDTIHIRHTYCYYCTPEGSRAF